MSLRFASSICALMRNPVGKRVYDSIQQSNLVRPLHWLCGWFLVTGNPDNVFAYDAPSSAEVAAKDAC